MIALLDGVVSDELLHEVAGRELCRPLSLLHMAGTARWRDKHLLFLAEAGAQQPFALVKWGQGLWVESLVREQAAMSQVRATSNPALLASCPPSWGPFGAGPDTVVTIERYLPSQSIYSQYRGTLWPRLLVNEHFRRVSSWLRDFAEATLVGRPVLDEALLEEHIESPLRTFIELFGDDFVPRTAIDKTIDAAREHLGQHVPLFAEHGDLWPSNLLLPRSQVGGLYVVDWEHYRPVSLGGFDMLFFCNTYAREFPWQLMRWLEYDEALRRTFMQRTWLARHIEGALASYCAAIELPRTLVPALLSVLMVRKSVQHVQSAPGRIANPQAYWPATFRVWCARPADSWLDVWAGREIP
jgi:hypothetical protein